MAFSNVAGQTSRYRHSYSGVDARAYAHFPGRSDKAVLLESLHTISWSIHEAKGQARALGYRGVRGFSRGVRCIPETGKVLIKDKGYISIKDVKPGDYVQSSGFTFDKVLGSYKQGIKECYELKLKNGFNLIASYDHPISTHRGWVETRDLIPDEDLVDVVGYCPSTEDDYPISDDLLKLIALLIGDGQTHSYVKSGGSVEYRIALSIADTELSTIGVEVATILSSHSINFRDTRKGTDKCISRIISTCVGATGKGWFQNRQYNELHKTLLKYNLYDKYSHTKEIPQEFIGGLSRRQVAIFLSYLFSADGCYSIGHKEINPDFCSGYSSSSSRLIEAVRLFLLKLGISSCKSIIAAEKLINYKRPEIIAKHDSHRLEIVGIDLVKLIKRVEIFGKVDRIKDYESEIIYRNRKHLNVDSKVFFQRVQSLIKLKGLNRVKMKSRYQTYNYNLRITPRKALDLVIELDDPDFTSWVDSLIEDLVSSDTDYRPRLVKSVESVGNLEVYDLEVENRHAFICDFIRVHNTVAGSLIMTVIEDNPLAPVMDVMAELYLDPALRWQGWSMDWQTVGVGSGLDNTTFNRRLAATLSPINILVQYVAEGSQWVEQPVGGSTSLMDIPGAAVLLEGVEFIDEGAVTSVSDSATEMSYSFIAMDCKTFSQQQFQQVINTGYPQDPGLANANVVQQMITGVYQQKSDNYKSQNNFINGGGTGFGAGDSSSIV